MFFQAMFSGARQCLRDALFYAFCTKSGGSCKGLRLLILLVNLVPSTRIERATLPLGVSFKGFSPTFTTLHKRTYLYTNHQLTAIV